jgi:hypothetical protein
MNLIKTISLGLMLFSFCSISAQDYFLEKKEGVKTLEYYEFTTDKEGKSTKKLSYIDSFDVSGNLLARKYSYGETDLMEYQDGKITKSSVNFPDCISGIQATQEDDNTLVISRSQIKSRCNFAPPPPPMRFTGMTYDSLFENVEREVSNTNKLASLTKILSFPDSNTKLICDYAKSGWGRKKVLSLQKIEQEERINKNFRIKRTFKVNNDKLYLIKQEIIDNQNGLVKVNSFNGFDPLEWMEVDKKMKKQFKYKFDRSDNWTKRKKGKKVVAERVISYY